MNSEYTEPPAQIAVVDITERKHIEDSLRESEEKYRVLVENMNSGVFVTTMSGTFLQMNKSMVEMSGYDSIDDLMSKPAMCLYADQADREHLKERLMQDGEVKNMEILCRKKDGTPHWISLNAVSQRDKNGNPDRILGIANDITARKQLEDAHEKRLVALTLPLDKTEGITFENLFDPVALQRLQDEFAAATGVASIITQPDGTPITRPSNFCRLCTEIIRCTETGRRNCYYSDSVIGRYHPDGPIIQTCLSGGLWDAGASITIGNRHIANWLIGQVRDETQNENKIRKYAHIIGVDETSVVEAFREVPSMSHDRFTKIAQALFTLSKQLSTTAYQNIQQARFISDLKRAAEKNVRLENQLLHAQKMESVGRLAGGVAHDFNNMLGVILGHVEMALEELDPNLTIYDDLTEIRKAAERSANLTRQLLAFARKQTVIPKVIDLNDTVTSMLKMLHRLIGEDIELTWNPGVRLWPVKMDPSQIDQILANLCVNARDAISGAGRISIETENITFDETFCSNHPDSEPGNYVRLSVSDNGSGMNKETQDHIFEPFFTTKGVGAGTGLGLSTVYGAIKQNNGYITAHSEEGQGTTFSIYLPGYVGKDVSPSTEITGESLVCGKETILLVEDESAILNLATKILEKQGYTVMATNSPGEAIRRAEEFTGELHLLITDVVMPEMNGRELAKKILSFYPNLKRIFMSGYTADVIANQGILEEGVPFIQKPFSIKDLTTKVRAILDQKTS